MDSQPSTYRPTLRIATMLLIILTGLAGVVTPSGGKAATPIAPADRSLPVSLPQAGTPLPVFKVTTPLISAETTHSLVQRFDRIYARQAVLQDAYLGHARFTVVNTQTNTLLEQYGATGGFYAYNAMEAFSETSRGIVDAGNAQLLACRFVMLNQLLPSNVRTPNTQNCDFNPQTQQPYKVTLAYAATQAAQAQPRVQVIGALVQVPMELVTGEFSQIPAIPLRGAGGHISLLFSTTSTRAQGFSLDSSVPGLAAVALPFHDREFTFLRSVPAVDPVKARQQIVQQIRAAFPTGTNISVPQPELAYNVTDAATPQGALEPELNFVGAQVTVDGIPLALKEMTMPAVEAGVNGFGPTITISSPKNGSIFVPGSNVTLTGNIINGTAPYSYTWTLDDGTVLKAGTLAVAGKLSVTTNKLPAIERDRTPLSTMVHLWVQDQDGARREAVVSLMPLAMQHLFVPIIRKSVQDGAAVASSRQSAEDVLPAASNYSFGIEMASDYPPYGAGGSDLGGVPPDANGLRAGLLSTGWAQTFFWANAAAWERDWRDCGLGGGDCTYGVDRTDFVYYTGHGSNGGLAMPSSVDSSWFAGTNARFQRARWVGFSSCLTLRAQWDPASAAPIRDWFNAFQGAHMLLGFNSVMADIPFGGRLIDNMRIPTFFGIPFPWAQRTIREAWVLTAFEMNAGKPAYIYAVGTNGVNPADNKLPQPGDPLLPRPFPVAGWNWVWWDE